MSNLKLGFRAVFGTFGSTTGVGRIVVPLRCEGSRVLGCGSEALQPLTQAESLLRGGGGVLTDATLAIAASAPPEYEPGAKRLATTVRCLARSASSSTGFRRPLNIEHSPGGEGGFWEGRWGGGVFGRGFEGGGVREGRLGGGPGGAIWGGRGGGGGTGSPYLHLPSL